MSNFTLESRVLSSKAVEFEFFTLSFI